MLTCGYCKKQNISDNHICIEERKFWEHLTDIYKDKLSRRNMQIKELKKLAETNEQRADRYNTGYKDGLRKAQEYARYCIKCKTITFQADTYGTWTNKDWEHYNCN